jgi:hypothetical protein
MNDYESLAEDVQQAIDVTETAYCNAVDAEDQETLQEVLDKLLMVKARAEAKA